MSLRPESPDERIAELLRSNSPTQINEGVALADRHYGRRVLALARKLVSDADLADELYNDTLLDLHKMRRKVASSGINVLLFCLIRRRVIDFRRKRHINTVALDAASEGHAIFEDPIARLIETEQLQRVIQKLNGTDRRIVELVVGGSAADEIAKRLQLQEGAVRTRITRLHQRLNEASATNGARKDKNGEALG